MSSQAALVPLVCFPDTIYNYIGHSLFPIWQDQLKPCPQTSINLLNVCPALFNIPSKWLLLLLIPLVNFYLHFSEDV